MNKNNDNSQNFKKTDLSSPLIKEKMKTNDRKKSVIIEDPNNVSQYSFPREMLITQLKKFKKEIILI